MSNFIGFFNTFRKFGLEALGRYYSQYPGFVTNTQDPEKRGRILVELPTLLGVGQVHPSWAEPHFNPIAGLNSGEFFPPYIGDRVDVFFEHGDLNHPRYKGGRWEKGDLPTDFQGNYGNIRGWVFRNGTKILVDETVGSEKITVLHKSGSVMTWNPDGSISIKDASGGELLSLKSGSVTVNSGGTVKVNASGKCIITASEIDLNGTAGKVLTSISDPILCPITGLASVGVPDVKAS